MKLGSRDRLTAGLFLFRRPELVILRVKAQRILLFLEKTEKNMKNTNVNENLLFEF